MRPDVSVARATRCYAPHEPFSRIFKDLLQWEKEALELQREIKGMKVKSKRGGDRSKAAATNTSTTIEERQKSLKLRRRALDRRKVELLNKYIFPSMANLTVFLEAMSESGFIEHMFRNDLKALFLSKSKTLSTESKVPMDRYKASRSIFHRFAEACCRLTIPSPDTPGAYVIFDESRLILCDIMQKTVYDRVLEATETGRGPFEFDDPNSMTKTFGADMLRARSWTDMIASKARKQLRFDEEGRPPLF